MVREVIGSVWDRTNRNNVNNNFEELYNGLGTAVGNDKKLNDFLNGVGVVSSRMLQTNSVYGDTIRDGGIGTRHLLDNTVSRAKIQDGAVATAKIQDGAVTTAKIPDNNIIDRHIANKSISGLKIANGTIPTLALEPQSVTQTRLANRSVGSQQIQTGAVAEENVADEAISAEKTSFDALSLNKGKDFPLKLLSGGHSILFQNTYLDIKVSNAQSGAQYRVYSILKDSTDYPEEGIVTAIQIQKRDTVTSEWDNLLTLKNQDKLENGQTGIGTHLIKSPDILEEVIITLDWDMIPSGETFNGVREYIIDESLYSYLNPIVHSTERYYNQKAVKSGYYVASATGIERASENWSVTGFIRVNPRVKYFKNRSGQLAFYDGRLNYISGHTNSLSNMLFTTPDNAKYIKTSIRNGDERGFELLRVDPDRISPVKGLFKNFYNPFRLSYVKVIGDSNAAGVGGTGYTREDDTNELIPGTSSVYANEDGHCWANSLGDHLLEKFNKDQKVALNHEEVRVVEGISHTTEDSNSVTQFNTTLFDGAKVEFDFYGDDFIMITNPSEENALIKVFFDDVQAFTFKPDALNYNKEVLRSSGGFGQKKISMQASGGDVELSGLKLRKQVKFKNFGVTGRSSRSTIQNLDHLLDGEESIVMCLVGSNDRGGTGEDKYEVELINNLRYIYMKIADKGASPVLLSSTPASIYNEVDFVSRSYHKEDVDTATMSAAATFGYEHISVYNHVLDYCLYTGTEVDDLLADGVHPNDAGYDVAFNYILKKIGLGRKRPGATW